MAVNKFITEGFPIKDFKGITINKSLLSNNSNYYTYASRNVKYIVIHYTGNSSDTAKANANYFNGGSRGASAHYFVDEKNCYQSVALHNAAWAVGGTKTYKHSDCRNLNSISIEMCCSRNYTVSNTTIENAAHLCAALCRYIGIKASDVDTYVLRHYDVWAKSCPAQWASANSEGWTTFKKKVKAILNENGEELTMAQYDELKKIIDAQNEKIKALEAVAESTFIYNYNDDNVPEWAREALTAAIKCGAVKGDEKGMLHLNYKDLRNIVREFRCGMYDVA